MTGPSIYVPISSSFRGNEGAIGKNWQREILLQAKVWKVWEYLMYFSLSELHGCGKRSVVQPQTVASEFPQKWGKSSDLCKLQQAFSGKFPMTRHCVLRQTQRAAAKYTYGDGLAQDFHLLPCSAQRAPRRNCKNNIPRFFPVCNSRQPPARQENFVKNRSGS